METDMKVFVGMVKGTNLFLLGQVVDQGEKKITLKWSARVFEVPSGDGRIGYQFHPDPYFTNESVAEVDLSEFLIHRVETDSDSKLVREYSNFLTQVRIQKSGLVTNADKIKPFTKG
jgi:hypothetical protein